MSRAAPPVPAAGPAADGALATRDARVERFLATHGLADVPRRPLAGDASARRYFRLEPAGRPTLILADSPFPDADVRPFIAVGGLLSDLGFSVPEILASAPEDGQLLLEDFGDHTFSRLLDGGADAGALYGLATDVLIALHRRFATDRDDDATPLPCYDAARLIDQVMLFADAYLPVALGRPLAASARDALEDAWRAVVPAAFALPQTLILRDYHVDNLMRLPARPGVGACGLLDFQSAGHGPIGYDLVSLIEDTRRDVPRALADAMVERYFAAFPTLDRGRFLVACDVLGAIRHARVIGIFAKIARCGRRGYLRHLPRVWRQLSGRLARPALAPVAAWFDRHLPPDRRGGWALPEVLPVWVEPEAGRG